MSKTLDDSVPRRGDASQQAGIVVVFAHRKPSSQGIAFLDDTVSIGREMGDPVFVGDPHLSRRHATITRVDGGFRIEDHDSRNGTYVDGKQVSPSSVCAAGSVVRVGRTLLLPVDDVRPYRVSPVQGEAVVGVTLRARQQAIVAAARTSRPLLVTGESGTGKELAARWFHAAGRFERGPLVPVNCAAIPEGVAERLLFGARRGAYSGLSADAVGFVQAAESGVLFLDELGELDLQVQAKLLRVVETGEVTPLGATTAKRIDFALCCATNRDLKRAVDDGRFRADLLFRIGERTVELPPLRERRDEIPWLVAREVERGAFKPKIDARFVEALMLRPWQGNVRELLGLVRQSVADVEASSGDTLRVELLGGDGDRPSNASSLPPRQGAKGIDDVSREDLVTALRASKGKIAAAARALGLHRMQVYRLVARHGVNLEED